MPRAKLEKQLAENCLLENGLIGAIWFDDVQSSSRMFIHPVQEIRNANGAAY